MANPHNNWIDTKIKLWRREVKAYDFVKSLAEELSWRCSEIQQKLNDTLPNDTLLPSKADVVVLACISARIDMVQLEDAIRKQRAVVA